MELIGFVKNDDWGKIGKSSAVAQIAALNSSEFALDESITYSELWMGDHKNGPCKVKSTGLDLKLDKSQIGGHKNLPFLLKVLSIRKALSIQVHPNKADAEKLHHDFPDIYKDGNHKPELAIALSPFIALVGFRPYNEIIDFCQNLPPLAELLGRNNVAALSEGEPGVKACFSALMKSKQKLVNNCIKEILQHHKNVLAKNKICDAFIKCYADFANDVGVLCLFFFNLMRLQPGEAIFLPANEPHSYLDGDIIECMSCSDNVIRAGFTQKYKDVETLLKMLNYAGEDSEKKKLKPVQFDPFVQLYIPTVKDFSVAVICIPSSEALYKWVNCKFGSIILVVCGKKKMKVESCEIKVQKGSIVFMPGIGDFIEFHHSNEDDNIAFKAYIAMYNSF